MKFEWDEAKRARVPREHGLDFANVTRAFQGPTIDDRDEAHSQSEERWRMLAILDGEVIFVIYAEGQDTIRLITARKATLREAQLFFEQCFGEQL